MKGYKTLRVLCATKDNTGLGMRLIIYCQNVAGINVYWSVFDHLQYGVLWSIDFYCLPEARGGA